MCRPGVNVDLSHIVGIILWKLGKIHMILILWLQAAKPFQFETASFFWIHFIMLNDDGSIW